MRIDLRFFAALFAASLLSTTASAQIFEDDFDDNAAGWTFESLTGNFGINGSDATFGYDYSADGIPEAPNSDPGDTSTSGVRLRTNKTSLPNDQANIFLEDANFSGSYQVEVDMWLNWPPAPGALGTTIFGGLYVGDARPGEVDTNSPAQRGAGFLASSDGDCGNCDYILLKNQFEMDTFSGQYSVTDFGFGNQPGYDNTDSNTNAANGALIDIPALFPAVDIDAVTGGVQNAAGEIQAAGAVGFQWVTLTAVVDPTDPGLGPAPGQTPSGEIGTATFTVTNSLGQELLVGTVDNSRPDILDDDGDGDDCDGGEDICVNLNNPLDGDVPVDLEGRVSLAIVDFFAGAASNIDLSYALFDNLVVSAVVPPLAGDYNDDGVVDAADYTAWRDSLGSSSDLAADGNDNGVIDPGDYTVWENNFGATSSASASAVPEPTAAVLLAAGLLAGVAPRRRG